MTPHHEGTRALVLTATLTTGVARVTHGMRESQSLIDRILTLDHAEWETILWLGDTEYHQTEEGPYPDHQMRVSVRPSAGYAALNYTNNSDPDMSIANSYNPRRPLPEVHIVFNGTTGAVFPRAAAIPIDSARDALHEWLETRRRPTCIEWRSYDRY